MATTTDPAPEADSPLGADTQNAEQVVSAEDTARNPLPWRTIALGCAGTIMIMLSALGAGGILVHDPVLGHGPLSWVRYGHGQMLCTAVLYLGFGLVVWAWVRLGRHVLAGRVGSRPVLIASAAWIAPLIFSPPVFTRDVFSYIAQGTLPLYGYDPYALGPVALNMADVVQNVHPFWQTTPAPYGPFFILLAKGVASIAGSHMIFGVILMRLTLMIGLGLMVWALPGLVKQLGGKLPVTLWLALASPMTVVHLVGGPHNDLLMLGFLTAGTLLVLQRKHVAGIALVTLAMAIKATAGVALPFLVLVWAGHLKSTWLKNFVRAGACALGVFTTVFAATTLVAGVNLGWITALRAPTMIVNWLSLPTGVGELLHWFVNLFFDVPKTPFVVVARILGGLALIVIAVRQWLRSREGGPDAVKRMALVLFLVAVLSPATLPWYLTWGFVIATAMAWKPKYLPLVGAAAVFLVLTYSPSGEDLLYKWTFIACAAAVSVLAGVSLLKPDPLRLFIRHHEDPEVDEPPAEELVSAGQDKPAPSA